jgi:hypothetical protein
VEPVSDRFCARVRQGRELAAAVQGDFLRLCDKELEAETSKIDAEKLGNETLRRKLRD